jgi:hypothetical protein
VLATQSYLSSISMEVPVGRGALGRGGLKQPKTTPRHQSHVLLDKALEFVLGENPESVFVIKSRSMPCACKLAIQAGSHVEISWAAAA